MQYDDLAYFMSLFGAKLYESLVQLNKIKILVLHINSVYKQNPK